MTAIMLNLSLAVNSTSHICFNWMKFKLKLSTDCEWKCESTFAWVHQHSADQMTHNAGCESIKPFSRFSFFSALWFSWFDANFWYVSTVVQKRELWENEIENVSIKNFVFASRFDKGMNFNDSQMEHMVIIKLHITESVPAERIWERENFEWFALINE